MRKLSQVLNEAKKNLEIQDDTVNYVSEKDLKAYLEICKKFLNEDSFYVIDWLINNNNTYVKDFTDKKDSSGNALADFYNAGVPKDASLKELYKHIGLLSKAGLLMQIPVFLQKKQLDDILSKKVAPDEIFLDLTTEKGRNEVAKKYNKLVWKIARSFNGKSSFTLDELYSIGLEGLTYAMNNYGKSQTQTQKKKTSKQSDEELDDMLNSEKEKARKQYTFLSYAGYMIRISILEAIKNESHLVRVPISQQNKERKETGKNTKSNSVSGDATVGYDKNGNGKSLFDTIGASTKGGNEFDNDDAEKLWKDVKSILSKKFSEKVLGIFYDFTGIFGHEKLSGKEIMKKYGLKNPSEITANNFKVKSFMYNDKTVKKLITELYTLYQECQQEYEDDSLYDPVKLNEKMNMFVESTIENKNNFVDNSYEEWV